MSVLDTKSVAAAVEERSGELSDLTAELIRFDTTTRGSADEPAKDETRLQEHLAVLLEGAGAEVEVWEPETGALDKWSRQVPEGLEFAGRPQLVAKFQSPADGRSLLFNGHIDVVSAEPRDRWSSDPFEPVIRDGRLYGRGACDMKGGVAAMVIAAIALAENGLLPAGELIVNTVTDEEWNGAGGLAAVARGVGADAGIVPEASGFEPWVACRGIVCATATVLGRSGHAEQPQPDWRDGGAVNAIEKALPVLEAFRTVREQWRSQGSRNELLHPGDLVPTRIDGGDWWVNYPAACKMTIDITYLPEQAADDAGWASDLQQEIESTVVEQTREDPWLSQQPPTFEWSANLPPAEVPVDHPIVRHLLDAGDAIGRPGKVGALQTWHDAATFTRFGTPSISYGPSGISNDGKSMAHAVDEFVPVDDLLACAKALAITAATWCEGSR